MAALNCDLTVTLEQLYLFDKEMETIIYRKYLYMLTTYMQQNSSFPPKMLLIVRSLGKI